MNITETIRILNLYAGIGGNRKLWDEVANIEVTAVEINPEVAKTYQKFYPKDQVLIEDAHLYLIENYQEYDFIWSSPPCPTHSHVNNFLHAQGVRRYPDMALWQEIIYLQKFAKNQLWVIENVKPYYPDLIKPTSILGRHYFWSNFPIVYSGYKHSPISVTNAGGNGIRRTREQQWKELQEYHDIYLDEDIYLNHDKFKVLSNCVHPPLGKIILECALNKIRTQSSLEGIFTYSGD